MTGPPAKRKKPPSVPNPPVRRGTAKRAVDAVEPPPKNFDIKDNQQLRWLAGLHYATSLTGTTVAEMAQTEPFTMVTGSTLFRWSRDDRWIEKQRRYRDQIAEKIQARLGDEQVRHHLRMLKDMQGVYQKIVDLLQDEDAPKPKSYESLVRAYTKLVLAIGEIRRDVVGFVAPRPELSVDASDDSPELTSPMVSEISEDEAKIAAEAILRQRMLISDGTLGEVVDVDKSEAAEEEG